MSSQVLTALIKNTGLEYVAKVDVIFDPYVGDGHRFSHPSRQGLVHSSEILLHPSFKVEFNFCYPQCGASSLS